MTFVGQLSDVMNKAADGTISQGGIAAILFGFFVLLIARDVLVMWHQNTRESNREAIRSAELDRILSSVSTHDEARDKRMGELTRAMSHLVQSNLLETLSRPHLLARARADAEALQREVGGDK